MTEELSEYDKENIRLIEFYQTYEKHHRNEVLEEVAKQFDKMPFGDTAASFAIFVRNMKT